MTEADNIRNSIIDKLLTISNKNYLSSLYDLLNKSSDGKGIIQLTEAQISMLKMSDEYIKNNRIIKQEALDKMDLEWLINHSFAPKLPSIREGNFPLLDL